MTPALATGLTLGFLVAMPLGPIGLLCVRSVLRNGVGVGAAIGLGAAMVDVCYAALGLLGVGGLLRASGLDVALGVVGGVVLVVIGGRTLWSAMRVRQGLETDGEVLRAGPAWRTAVAATASNPATIAYWAAAFAVASSAAATDGATSTLLMLLGVGLGTFAWFLVLALGVAAFRRRAGARTQVAADVVAGLGLMAFGGVLTYHAVEPAGGS